MSLTKYKKKRNFQTTPEPDGDEEFSEKKLEFVVHRHKASHLHYDLRLEMEGVLKSWAVPKGPSMNPADKRLAMMVEDHPYEYRLFKGVIPEGNYGAGIVEIWDHGTYIPLGQGRVPIPGSESAEHVKNGSLKFFLKGRKLKGEFALVKMKTSANENAWLLIKHDDQFAVHTDYYSEHFTSPSSPINRALKKKEMTEKKDR
jgi:bifunctional non-homologous end joining protein LigD